MVCDQTVFSGASISNINVMTCVICENRHNGQDTCRTRAARGHV